MPFRLKVSEVALTQPKPSGSIFRNRQFSYLWSAQALSQTAQQATWFGMLVVVEETSRSTAVLGAAILSTVLPGVFVGLIAGVFVDRSNKKNVLVWTNLLRAFVILGYLLYPISLLVVFAVNALFVAISQFFGPAEASTIPALVRKEQLLAANTLFNLTFTISQLIGIVVLAPWVIKFAGAPALFIIIAALYLICTALVTLLPPGERPAQGLDTLKRETLAADIRRDLGEAWRFITADRQTWWSMIYLTTASSLILVMAMLAPRYMVEIMGIRAEDAVYLFAPAGLGVLLITLVVNRLSGWFSLTDLSHIGLALTTVALLAMAAIDWLAPILTPATSWLFTDILHQPARHGLVPVLALFSGAFGVGFGLVNIPSQTLLMTRAPVESRGRIFAVLLMMGNTAAVLPIVFLGGVADTIGVNTTVAIVGLLVAIVFAVGRTSLARAKPESPEPAETGS